MGRTVGAVVVAGALLLVGACGAGTSSPSSAPPSDLPSGSAPAVATTGPGAPTDAAPTDPAPGVVRDAGEPLAPDATPDAGSVLVVDGAALQREPGPDGAVTASVTGPAGVLAWVAPPRGGRAAVQTDGSATLQDDTGAVVAALGPPSAADGGRGTWRVAGEVLALDAVGGAASFVVGTAALASATWGEAEGGRSLAVVPADWVRGGSLAAQQSLSSQLQAAEPEAASSSMQAQLWCHVLGAPDKASWNIEPWRPDVGTGTMLATRCNPTDADL